MVTTLAGNPFILSPYDNTPEGGYADGAGVAALFGNPAGVAVDPAGNVLVAEAQAIRKVTAAGVVTTLAGTPYAGGDPADGTGSAVRFGGPWGVAVDGAGNLYVAEETSNTIRKVTAAGVVTTLAGSSGVYGYADGTGSAARLFQPWGVAVDAAGNVFVADQDNQLIRKVTATGLVTTLAGSPGAYAYADGTGSAARFWNPASVAVDGAGNVFVADSWNQVIRKVTPTGVVTTLAGNASILDSYGRSLGSYANGTGSAAGFYGPWGVAADAAGNVIVADAGNNAIRKITAAGVVTTLAGPGAGSADGTGSAARFSSPAGVAVDAAGNVFVADYNNHTIRKVTAAGVVTSSGK